MEPAVLQECQYDYADWSGLITLGNHPSLVLI